MPSIELFQKTREIAANLFILNNLTTANSRQILQILSLQPDPNSAQILPTTFRSSKAFGIHKAQILFGPRRHAVPCELIGAFLSAFTASHWIKIFELYKFPHLHMNLVVAPPRRFPDLFSRENHVVPGDPRCLRVLLYHFADNLNQTSPLRTEFIEAFQKELAGQIVGDPDIGFAHLDIFETFVAVLPHFDLFLILSEKSNGPDKAVVFLLLAPRPKKAVQKPELLRVRIHHFERLDQTLHVLMKPPDFFVFPLFKNPFQGFHAPLDFENFPGLRLAFIHR